MINKKIYYFAIPFVLLAVYYYSPETKQEDVKRLARYFTSPQVNSCIKEWEHKFEDPDSLIYLDSYENKEGDLRQLKIQYKVKNVYGAYTSSYLTCGLDTDGKLDSSETFKYQTEPYYGTGIELAPKIEMLAPEPAMPAPEPALPATESKL